MNLGYPKSDGKKSSSPFCLLFEDPQRPMNLLSPSSFLVSLSPHSSPPKKLYRSSWSAACELCPLNQGSVYGQFLEEERTNLPQHKQVYSVYFCAKIFLNMFVYQKSLYMVSSTQKTQYIKVIIKKSSLVIDSSFFTK